MSHEGKVKLKASDDEVFEVEEVVAFESETIKEMAEDAGTENVIPLFNVSSKTLSKVIEYCRYHVLEAPATPAHGKPAISEDDVNAWDAEFINVNQATLFDLVVAANNLKIKNLMDLTCLSMLKGMTLEQLRRACNINNNFTPEMEEEVRRENPWAFE